MLGQEVSTRSSKTADANEIPQLGVDIRSVSHRYGSLEAIKNLTLSVESKEIFGVLGPNGSGKSTLFRLLSTLVAVQRGDITVAGFDTKSQTAQVRSSIGVVFQAPSLDRKLTVLENIQCQAALVGLRGAERTKRISEVVSAMGLDEKLRIRCERLSGGQKRRVELAKGLLHQPRVLLLDEPSTGLDPAARLDLWHALVDLKESMGTTVLLTTHLLEEADKCDRIAILHQGTLVACDSPDTLRAEAGDVIVTIACNESDVVVEKLRANLGLESSVVGTQVRAKGHLAVASLQKIVEETRGLALSVSVGRPSLEDVFIAKTGHRFFSA